MDTLPIDIDRYLALLAFAFAGTWTPGPNNMMLTNSGARFGFRRTLPHALGVALGFSLMVFLMAFGLGQVFQSSEIFREALRWAGAALLLWIGWRIATAEPRPMLATGAEMPKGIGSRPFTFIEAAGFQWINPKAWAMAIGVVSTYLAGREPLTEALIATSAFVLAGMTSAHGWAAFGASIQGLLSTETRLRAFNIAMGMMVAGFVVFLFTDEL